MYTVKKLLAIAIAELGYMEKETNSMLDHKTANAGDGNWTRYARDLHAAGYYQAPKNGYAWCDMFVDWLFYKLTGSKEKGEYLECQTGLYGAGCEWSSDPYHCRAVNDAGVFVGGVYGWVDANTISAVDKPAETDWVPDKGDVVMFNGDTHYTSSNSNKPKKCQGGKAKITATNPGSKHPFHLVRIAGGGATVYGWVDAGTFTKA